MILHRPAIFLFFSLCMAVTCPRRVQALPIESVGRDDPARRVNALPIESVGRVDPARRVQALPPMSLRGREASVVAQPFARNERYGCGIPLAGAISCRYSLPARCRHSHSHPVGRGHVPAACRHFHTLSLRGAQRRGNLIPSIPSMSLR